MIIWLPRSPDLIINVVDITNLERNLYLTMQLLELGIPMIMALNIFDEAEAKGAGINTRQMEGAHGNQSDSHLCSQKDRA